MTGNPGMIPVDQFEQAVVSLKGYYGVVGVFGGNPAMHPQFDQLCAVLRRHIPFEQRGLWCNNPLGNGHWMRETFNPAVSNLNVHMDRRAYDEFKRDWPECNPVGLDRDSRHAPVFLSMRDLNIPEEERWELISRCDINQHWSALIGLFRGQLRAWFCEVAGAMAMLHQDEMDYPDTGLPLTVETTNEFNEVYRTHSPWWMLPMADFAEQVRWHCHDCGVPLRGRGAMACDPNGMEQTSRTHLPIYTPKRQRRVQEVHHRNQVQEQAYARMTNYLGNQ